MEELGIQSGVTVIKDAPHPFLGKQVWFDEMIEVADTFFAQHLKDQKSALRELGIADEGAAQLMVDSGFESLAMGIVQDTDKVQRGWEVQRHGRDSIRQALKVEVLDGASQAKSGRRCLALSIPQTTVGFEYVTIGQRHRSEAGVEYEASVWVRWPTGRDDLPVAKRGTQTSSAIVSFWVRHRDGEGHFAGRDVWLMDNRWQQLTFRFRPTDSELPSLIYLSLLPHQKPVATTLLVDDFQLAKEADSAGVDSRHEQLVLDPDFSKQDKRTISPPWYFANMNGAGIPGVVESESENRFVRMSMGEATSNFESAQLWQHVHLIEGATYEISCSMRWDNFAKDVGAPIINYGIYHDKSNTWYGPVDQVLKKNGGWQTYRFTGRICARRHSRAD